MLCSIQQRVPYVKRVVQFMEVTRKRDDLVECAKLLEVPSPDFSSLEVARKDLALHKSKWDLLGTFRQNREAWMTCPVRPSLASPAPSHPPACECMTARSRVFVE